MTIDLTQRREFVEGLRDLASLFDTHEELQLPTWKQDINVFLHGDVKQLMAAAAKALGCVDKSYGDELFELQRGFGALLQLRIIANRDEVCERVVIATKVEPAHIIPAQEEKFVPEREVEIVEWRCTPLLSGGHADVEVPQEKQLVGSGQLLLEDDIPF